MKSYNTQPKKVRGIGNLHTERQSNEYQEEDCTKSSLGNHPFEGIDNNEYELTSEEITNKPYLTLIAVDDNILLKENYTLQATLHDENGDIIQPNGVTFFINNNTLSGTVTYNNNIAILTKEATATNPGVWGFTAKTVYNNTVYTSNQILIKAVKRPVKIEYPSTVKQNTPYTGRLTDKNTGEPIPEQTILLRMSREDGTSKTYTLKTDENGYFTYPQITLSLGTYYFTIIYQGTGVYESYQTDMFPVEVNTIKRQSQITGITDEIPRGDYFTAKLIDYENQQPIPNQSVNILMARTGTSTPETKTYTLTTDSDGFFKIQINLTEGTYSFTMTYNGNETYEGATESNHLITVIPNDKKSTYIDASDTVTQFTDYQGVLTDAQGNPIEGRNIEITMCKGTECKTYGTGKVDSNGNVNTLITTNSNGSFTKYIELTPGTYTFTTEFKGDDNYAPSTKTHTVTVLEKTKDTPSIIVDNEVYQNDDITGRLLTSGGEGIIGRTLTILMSNIGSSENAPYTTSTTNENGTFTRLIQLNPGTYNFTYVFDGTNDATYNSVTYGPVVTEVKENDTETQLELLTHTISQGDYIEFQLTDENDDPLINKAVDITFQRYNSDTNERSDTITYTQANNTWANGNYDSNNNPLTGLTNNNGIIKIQFNMDTASKFTYYVWATFHEGGGYAGSSTSRTALITGVVDTTLSLTRTPSSSTVEKGSDMTLNATLLDENNQPVQNAPIVLNILQEAFDTSISLSLDNGVVSATVLDELNNPAVGVSVQWYNASNDALLATSTTDSSGVATYTAASGVSSVYGFVVSTDEYNSVTSENIELSPYLFYDDCTDNSMLSTYQNATLVRLEAGSSRPTITYKSGYYQVTTTAYAITGLILAETSNDVKITMTTRVITSSGNTQMALFLRNNNSSNRLFKGVRSGDSKWLQSNLGSNATFTFDYYTWYTFIVTRQGTSITFSVKNASGTVLASQSGTLSNLGDTYTPLQCGVGFGLENDVIWDFKHISIENI